MISYPCFPPLLRSERTNRSRKLFTIRSLTALVILSRELSRFDIIEFQYKPPLKRVSHHVVSRGSLGRERAFQGLQCTECHTTYPSGETLQKCSKCTGILA